LCTPLTYPGRQYAPRYPLHTQGGSTRLVTRLSGRHIQQVYTSLRLSGRHIHQVIPLSLGLLGRHIPLLYSLLRAIREAYTTVSLLRRGPRPLRPVSLLASNPYSRPFNPGITSQERWHSGVYSQIIPSLWPFWQKGEV